jgi:hypothetical protein
MTSSTLDVPHQSEKRQADQNPPDSAGMRKRFFQNKSNRLILLQITLAVGVFVGLNLLAVAAIPHLMRIANYQRHDVYAPTRIAQVLSAPRQDVIFMGSSRVGVGFDPALTKRDVAKVTRVNIRAFNLGIDGSDISLHYLLLKNEITANKTPTVIVYGLAEYELDAPSPPSYTYLPYAKTLTKPNDYALYAGKAFGSKLDFVSRQLLPIYNERNLISDVFGIVFNPQNEWHKLFMPGPQHLAPMPDDFHNPGFGYRGGKRAINQCRKEYGLKLKNYRLDPARLLILNKFLTLAQQRHIQVILVNMPVSAMHRSWWGSAQQMTEYRAAVQSIALRHHVPLLDLYTDPYHNFPFSDFIDTHHLNETGADILTNLVAKRYLAPIFAKDHTNALQ